MFSLHKEWMMEDLRTLEADRNEVDKLSSELKDLEIEFTSLKSKGKHFNELNCHKKKKL